MFTQIQDLMSLMISQNSGNNNRNHNNTNIKNNSNNNRRLTGRGGRTLYYAGRTQSLRPSSTRQYFWTHGTCDHVGTKCMTPATGYQAQSTFSDMKNGSTNACYWLPTLHLGTARTCLNKTDSNTLSCYTSTGRVLVPHQSSNNMIF